MESQGRREAKEPSDHETYLVLGEREKGEMMVGWISVVLREFGKTTGSA